MNIFWIVTAAHCLDGIKNFASVRVRLGDTHRFYNDGSEQVFGVSKVGTCIDTS